MYSLIYCSVFSMMVNKFVSLTYESRSVTAMSSLEGVDRMFSVAAPQARGKSAQDNILRQITGPWLWLIKSAKIKSLTGL